MMVAAMERVQARTEKSRRKKKKGAKVMVSLLPTTPNNHLSFKGGGGAAAAQHGSRRTSAVAARRSKPAVTLCQWGHVEGSEVCRHSYRHYRLPSGRLAHFYSAVSVHQLAAPIGDTPPPPLTLCSLGDAVLVPMLRHPLRPPTDLGILFTFDPPPKGSLAPPKPTHHTLPVPPHGACAGCACHLFGRLPDAPPMFAVSEVVDPVKEEEAARKQRPPYVGRLEREGGREKGRERAGEKRE